MSNQTKVLSIEEEEVEDEDEDEDEDGAMTSQLGKDEPDEGASNAATAVV